MTDHTTPPQTSAEPAAAAPRRRVLRPVLIGVGSGLAVLALGAGGFTLAGALGDRDDDRAGVPLTGETAAPDASPRPSSSAGPDDDGRTVSAEEYARVAAAALEAVRGGEVVEGTRDDDPGVAWEVEIRLANGDEAEVELAEDLAVVRIDLDS